MTAGELFTAICDIYVNAGGKSVNTSAREGIRYRAEWHGRALAQKAAHFRPWSWMLGTGTATITSGSGNLPSDFGSINPQTRVYISSSKTALYPVSPAAWSDLNYLDGSSGTPDRYCVKGQTVAGLRNIYVYPSWSGTLTIVNYTKKTPLLVDYPKAPTLAAGTATGLTGAYQYRLTFATADGETEGGSIGSITLSATKCNLYNLAVPNHPSITHRYLYRTAAGGSTFYRHSELDLVTAYTSTAPLVDNTADGALTLTTSPPTPAAAVTGLEQFPGDFVESVLYDGLVARMMEGQGDDRYPYKDTEFLKGLRDMWVADQPMQNAGRRLPRYGSGRTYRRW